MVAPPDRGPDPGREDPDRGIPGLASRSPARSHRRTAVVDGEGYDRIGSAYCRGLCSLGGGGMSDLAAYILLAIGAGYAVLQQLSHVQERREWTAERQRLM